MASTSSSPIIASPTINYDIFLSFRGEDTRHSFTDHLYAALNNAGISAFRDNEEIGRGDELKPEIEKAIKASKGSIIVLSKKYATSTWCLEELWLILEQRREFNHFVLPIFYHVDPSDVRKQEKTFKIEVKTSSKWTKDNVKRWREALTKIVDLKGEQVSGSEVDFLKKIVDDIYNNKVVRKLVDLPRHLTGMNARYEYINSWLEQSDIKVFVISGMAGSGKTTLANYIVSLNSQCFESISIVKVMGGIDKHDNQSELIRKFSADLLGEWQGKFMGRNKIARLLKMKKALIVFDDIGEPAELDRFLGTGDINKRSKIIITTRRNETYNWLESRSWSCQEYNMQLLNDDESLELLSLHAFGFKIPREGYKEHAKEVLRYCDGNPLALEVLGSSLSMDLSIRYWKSTLDALEKDMADRIQSVLITSYNSLPNDLNRELFLHIACFFVGEDKDYVEQILEDDYCAPSGIKVLTNRSLLSVSLNNKLMMHQLIQEMGKIIIRKESKSVAERSRVWDSRDSYKILRKRKGSKTMEGLAFDMQDLRNNQQLLTSSEFTTDSLTQMDNLKLLQLKNVHLTGPFEDFSEDLRWLCWQRFYLPAIPSGLFQENLVAIDMSRSNLEVFEPPIVLPSLKILNLRSSEYLSEIRNISRLPYLETLILHDCFLLEYGCESIGVLKNLAHLNMEECISLNKSITGLLGKEGLDFLPQQTLISLPHSLVWLSLSDCKLYFNDFADLSFSGQPNLQYLSLKEGKFGSLPSYNHLKTLRVLDLSWCRELKQLLCLPSALAELYVYDCFMLERITFESHQFTLQEFGYQGCCQLFDIEGFIKLVPIANLVETDLGHMTWLKEYQNHEVRLVGDEQLTYNRIRRIQMLYEFGIMSTSLPDIKDPNMTSKHLSESPFVSFSVPPHPENRRLKGLNVTFKYTILSGQDWAWFAKIRTNNGVDLIYNPKVFGNPKDGGVGVWLSYWPIGSKLFTGDEVNVSIVVMGGILEVHECGASLVYTDDDDDDDETMEINMPWVETLGRDLSAFKLSTGAHYLCRRDFFKLMEVGGLTPGWLSILVGDIIDDREVRGWRKTGRPKPSFNPSQAGLSPSVDPSQIELSPSFDPSEAELSPLFDPSQAELSSSFYPSETESPPPSLTESKNF